MKNALDLGTYPREYCQGSLRPLATEVVLGLIPDGSMSYELKQKLRESATAIDPLWRDVMASLSVGPLEFGRFEAERIQGAIVWRALFTEALHILMNVKSGTRVFVTVTGSTKAERALVEVDGIFEVKG